MGYFLTDKKIVCPFTQQILFETITHMHFDPNIENTVGSKHLLLANFDPNIYFLAD
jgi:hypothetical protein